MAIATPTDEPNHSPDPVPPTGERGRRGHIGLIVLGSTLAGLVLGLVLVLGVIGGGEEATITGSALISLGAGMLILFLLSARRTDQPQSWALVPAIVLGAIGFALLIIKPGDRRQRVSPCAASRSEASQGELLEVAAAAPVAKNSPTPPAFVLDCDQRQWLWRARLDGSGDLPRGGAVLAARA
jgi:hypothetical protein